MSENMINNNLSETDGIDHYNIWFRGKTVLGRMLSHFYNTPFEHPHYGPFASMEGFWHYIKTKPSKNKDEIRTLKEFEAKEFGKKLEGTFCPNFRDKINVGNYYRIEQNPELKKLLIESELPLDHYFLFGPGNVLIRPKGFEWILDGFEENRRLFKNGLSPKVIDYGDN